MSSSGDAGGGRRGGRRESRESVMPMLCMYVLLNGLPRAKLPIFITKAVVFSCMFTCAL